MADEIPRVPLLSVADAAAAAAKAGISEQMAPLSVFRVLLRHPDVARELASTLTTLLFQGNKLDARLRELMLDIPEADLVATRDWKNASCLSDADRAILAATDETLDGGMISDATWAACAAHLKTAEERIELVVAIGNWTLFSQLLKSLKIPLEDGVVAWPPDGKKP